MDIRNKRFEIEFADVKVARNEEERSGQCRSVYFRPFARKMRGRVSAAILTGHNPGQELRRFLSKYRNIPGERVYIDFKKANSYGKGAKAVIGHYDGLTAKDLDFDPKAMLKSWTAIFRPGEEAKPADAKDRAAKTFDDVKNMLYWMRRAVDSGKAEMVDGSEDLPSLEEIKEMPGKRRVPGDTTTDKETRETLREYAFEVPLPGERQHQSAG